jgi:hypothetical protein
MTGSPVRVLLGEPLTPDYARRQRCGLLRPAGLQELLEALGDLVASAAGSMPPAVVVVAGPAAVSEDPAGERRLFVLEQVLLARLARRLTARSASFSSSMSSRLTNALASSGSRSSGLRRGGHPPLLASVRGCSSVSSCARCSLPRRASRACSSALALALELREAGGLALLDLRAEVGEVRSSALARFGGFLGLLVGLLEPLVRDALIVGLVLRSLVRCVGRFDRGGVVRHGATYSLRR